eukprot:TRINITY_DN523_c1_g3_i1.p1 TRINITY_DN523_c1_g3~~TRINITY_DN523_c1_g3_i1.p1  ORF type:complete len:229 (+),score=87.73 TRINITY_DN523_c1_g3_i1:84-689(+)
MSKIIMTNFCARQFEPGNFFAIRLNITKEIFTEKVNDFYNLNLTKLQNGYAPFCKHLFIPNFCEDLKVTTISINETNKKLLRSDYIARTEKELPVLTRWFPKSAFESIPTASFLDIILYSKEQILLENAELPQEDPQILSQPFEWGIVSIKPQMEDFELPMTPSTILRNALGKSEGGSGVPLNREQYLNSVQFWSKNASLI